MDELKICNLVNSFSDSSFVVDFANSLENHTRVDPVVVPVFERSELNQQPNFEIRYLDYSTSFPRRLEQIAKLATEYDVIHTHHNRAGAVGNTIGAGTDTVTVTTEHNNHDGFHPASRIANGVTNPFSDAVVFVSDSVAESVRRWERYLLNGSMTRVIYNGVDLERIDTRTPTGFDAFEQTDVEPDSVLVGSAGMHTKQKGYETLIRAVRLVNRNGDRNVELLLPGTGPRTEHLAELAARIGADGDVHFLGFLPTRNHVYDLLADVDIYAMPSRWEGHSVAALEAMALERPCLFSDIPSFSNPYRDVASFHRVDDPFDLAEQLERLATDPTRRRQLGTSGRAFVEEQFPIEKTARAYEQLYLALLARKNGSGRPASPKLRRKEST